MGKITRIVTSAGLGFSIGWFLPIILSIDVSKTKIDIPHWPV